MKLRYAFPPGLLNTVSLSDKAKQRLVWLDWYYGHQENARLTCRHFGLYPDTFYRWKKRFEKSGRSPRSLEDKSRRPNRFRQSEIPLEVIQRVIEIRKSDLEKSKYEIAEQLRREGTSLSPSSIQRLINRHSQLLNTQHTKRIRRRKHLSIKRKKAAKELRERSPGSLVQIDTKHYYLDNQRFYLFTAIDCKTRLSFTRIKKNISSQSAAEFLKELIDFFPFKVEAIQTDNGSEYLFHFHQKCEELGIPHYFTDPYCPKQNGRVERVIQTTEYEFLNYQDDVLPELDDLNERLDLWNTKYNQERFHQALDYQTPYEYLQSLVESEVT
jgi:transposase InsO family protein